jgi:hypothetical protein
MALAEKQEGLQVNTICRGNFPSNKGQKNIWELPAPNRKPLAGFVIVAKYCSMPVLFETH